MYKLFSVKGVNMNIDEIIQLFRFNNKHVTDLTSTKLIEISDLLEQLKEYQQLDEQGRLVKLPCKMRDTVYCIENKEIYTCTVEKISISKNNGVWVEINFPKEIPDIVAIEYNPSDIGKTVFLTKPEAEIKLKELRGKENESNN